MVFPKANLPTASQPWGRFVESSIKALEVNTATEKVNNAARDAQAALSIKRLDASVAAVAAATIAAQQAADLAQDSADLAQAAINGLGSLDEATSTYKINADNLTAGTITGLVVRTGSSGSRVVMDSTGLKAYNSGGSVVFGYNIPTETLTLSGYLQSGTAATDINNNSTTISGTKITTGTLSADKIFAGTISASSINLTSSSYQLTVGNSSQFAYLNVLPGSSNGVTINSIGFQSTSTAGWNTNMYPYLNNSVYCGLQAFAWAGIRSVTAVVVTSDERTKNSIADSDLGLEFIDSLRPVSYKFNVGKNEITYDEDGQINGSVEIEGKRKHYGLVAQEVKETLDSLNIQDFGGWILDDIDDPDSTQGLRYEEFISPLIKAVQELSARVKQLEGK